MADKPKTNRVLVSPEIGDSGVNIFNGIISGEEYNRNLYGRQALKIWDEMRRSDASVGVSLRAVKLPIKSSKFFTTPASDEDLDVEISELAKWNLFERIKWKKTLGEILTHLEFGFAVFEMVFEPELVNGTWRIVLTKLAYRKPTTIESWQCEDGSPGITQRLSNGKLVSIPLERLLVFTNEQEGDNYEGRSILRTAYKHWFYVDKFYQIDAVGAERQALGVVDIAYQKGTDQKTIESAKLAARNIRANEESSIAHPKDLEITFMDMKASTLKDLQPSISHHDRQITKNVLAQFLELGSSGGAGSRSTSEDHHELFNQSVQAVNDLIADTLGYVVKTLVDLNYNVDKYPTVGSSDIDQANIAALAETVSKFESAGFLTVSDEDEAHVRNLIGFPEKSDDVERKTSKTTDKPKLDAARRGKHVAASVSSRDFPDLYDGLDVDPNDLGCIMINTETLPILKHVPEDLHGELIDATSRHDHAMGAVAETEAHVTLLYGLLENGNVWKEKVDTVLEGWSLSEVTIQDVGYFETPDSFAVVAHIDKSPELIDGHERLTLLPHVQTFSEYRPHLTLAYVSKEADIDDWVDYLGSAYNGKTIKTKGINYGDLPEDGVEADVAQAKKLHASLTRRLYGNTSRAA